CFGCAAQPGENRFALKGRGSMFNTTEIRSNSQGQSMQSASFPDPMMLSIWESLSQFGSFSETKVTLGESGRANHSHSFSRKTGPSRNRHDSHAIPYAISPTSTINSSAAAELEGKWFARLSSANDAYSGSRWKTYIA